MMNHISIEHLVNEALSNQAFINLCKKGMNHSHNTYHLSPLQSYQIEGTYLSSWQARDAIVLKAMSILLEPLFHRRYPHCKHPLKSDIQEYDEFMNHDVLLSAFRDKVACEGIIRLIEQYCTRLEIKDGVYVHFTQVIPKGCPLSSLMGALMLKPLDDALSKKGYYVRFMDDWIILTNTKSKLRQVIKITHRILNQLKLKMHPDKTTIGRIAKGFVFLGIHVGVQIKAAHQSIENHRLKISQHYVQGMHQTHIDLYRKRWHIWTKSLLNSCIESISSMELIAILHISCMDTCLNPSSAPPTTPGRWFRCKPVSPGASPGSCYFEPDSTTAASRAKASMATGMPRGDSFHIDCIPDPTCASKKPRN